MFRRRFPLSAAIQAIILAAMIPAPVSAEPLLPARKDFHLYLLVGQSNMAGRGRVADIDRRLIPRVLKYGKDGRWVPALDPLHFDKPSVVGQMGRWPERPWSGAKETVDAAHRRLPTRVARTAFASARGLKHKGDKVHFNSASYRELGRRYAAAYLKLADPAKKSTRVSGRPNVVLIMAPSTFPMRSHFAQCWFVSDCLEDG